MRCGLCYKPERKAWVTHETKTPLCQHCRNRRFFIDNGISDENLVIEGARLRHERMRTRAANKSNSRITPKKIMPKCPACGENNSVWWDNFYLCYRCSQCTQLHSNVGLSFNGTFWYIKHKLNNKKRKLYVYLIVRDGVVYMLDNSIHYVMGSEALSFVSRVQLCEICKQNYILDSDVRSYSDEDGIFHEIRSCNDCNDVLKYFNSYENKLDDIPF